MFSSKMIADPVFRKFVRKKLLSYIIPNVFFNTCVPYFTFRSMTEVYLFNGELCFARFLLPMAFFLPFIITLDLIRKTIALAGQGKLSFELPRGIDSGGPLFLRAFLNGMVTLAAATFVALFVQFCVPGGYGFDGTFLAAILGLFAGILTLLFTFLSLRLIIRTV